MAVTFPRRKTEALQQGIDEVNKRQKLKNIADRSENGWLTAHPTENSDDEKRIARAEFQAQRRRKKQGTARGRGNYSFRGRAAESFRPTRRLKWLHSEERSQQPPLAAAQAEGASVADNWGTFGETALYTG